MIYREKPTKKIVYKKIFNEFSYESYMKMAGKFLKRAKKHFKENVDFMIFVSNLDKNKEAPDDLYSLKDITKDIFDNSKLIKVTMYSATKPDEYITSSFNKSSPREISLSIPQNNKSVIRNVF